MVQEMERQDIGLLMRDIDASMSATADFDVQWCRRWNARTLGS